MEMFRANALGSVARSLLVAVAQDPAMLIWAPTATTNTKAKAAGELRPRADGAVLSRGVGYYTEDDVYAAARVFTGWNLQQPKDPKNDVTSAWGVRLQRRPATKNGRQGGFSLSDLRQRQPHTIASRSASDGMQDGLDI